jgi:hypothetical protein
MTTILGLVLVSAALWLCWRMPAVARRARWEAAAVRKARMFTDGGTIRREA